MGAGGQDTGGLSVIFTAKAHTLCLFMIVQLSTVNKWIMNFLYTFYLSGDFWPAVQLNTNKIMKNVNHNWHLENELEIRNNVNPEGLN